MVALDETGKSYSSLEFSNKMMQWEESCKNLYFFIGGPDGLSKEIFEMSGHVLSMSNFTLSTYLGKGYTYGANI